jgi:hypothetical protein
MAANLAVGVAEGDAEGEEGLIGAVELVREAHFELLAHLLVRHPRPALTTGYIAWWEGFPPAVIGTAQGSCAKLSLLRGPHPHRWWTHCT